MNVMMRRVILLALLVVIPSWSGWSAEAPSKKNATVVVTESGGKLMITAKSVTYDFVKREAIFEKDVTVTDSQVMIDTDKLVVKLTKTNSVRAVEAEGNVVIRELGTAKKATAGKAVYNMQEDTLVLTDHPQLEEHDQGFYTRGAERIIYYRKEQRFKAEGENMQLEFGIPKKKGGHVGDLFGVPGSAKEEKKTP